MAIIGSVVFLGINPRAHLIHHFAEDFLFQSDCDVTHFYAVLNHLSEIGSKDLFAAIKYGISQAVLCVVNQESDLSDFQRAN